MTLLQGAVANRGDFQTEERVSKTQHCPGT